MEKEFKDVLKHDPKDWANNKEESTWEYRDKELYNLVTSKDGSNIVEWSKDWEWKYDNLWFYSSRDNLNLSYDTMPSNVWDNIWDKDWLKIWSVNDVFTHFNIDNSKENRKSIADNIWIEDYDYSAEKNQDLIMRSSDILRNHLNFVDTKQIDVPKTEDWRISSIKFNAEETLKSKWAKELLNPDAFINKNTNWWFVIE